MTIIAACKLPHGLTVGRVTLNGSQVLGTPQERAEKFAAFAKSGMMRFGYAITKGISDDDWAEFWGRIQHSDLVRSKMVFGSAIDAEVTKFCRENSSVSTGFEGARPGA